MKKTLSVILTVFLCVALAGCSGRASAESVTEDAIQAFQSADLEEIQRYWGEDPSSSDEDVYSQKLLEQLANGLTYQIIDSNEDENAGTATVTVEFTNIDMSVVLTEWMGNIFSQSLGYLFLPADQQPSEEELNDIYMERLSTIMEEHADNKVSNTVDVSLSLVDNAWKLETSDTVTNAMMGGMTDALGNVMDSLTSLNESLDAADISETEPERVNPATLGDYSVEIKSATITQDYAGDPAVVITYSWTNNSDETTSPFFSVETSVFQDGIALDSAIIMDNSVYDSGMQTVKVRPGTTIEVQAAFELYNTTSPIEVEITENFSFENPAEIAYMQFTLS